jgi:hypothetical protein
LEDLRRVRRGALGGTVNDVVLAAITRGFRDLLERRGSLREGLVVRSMVPVSVRQARPARTARQPDRGVFVDLPVASPTRSPG